MAIIDAKTTEVHVATVEAGPYTLIGSIHTWNENAGQQGGQEFNLLGTSAKITEAGSDDRTITLNYLLDLADTDGQNILRTAFINKTTIYTRLLYDGTLGVQQPMTVTSEQNSGDANGTGLGRYIAGTVTLTSAGTRTEITA